MVVLLETMMLMWGRVMRPHNVSYMCSYMEQIVTFII